MSIVFKHARMFQVGCFMTDRAMLAIIVASAVSVLSETVLAELLSNPLAQPVTTKTADQLEPSRAKESSDTRLASGSTIEKAPNSASIDGWKAETFTLPPGFAPELPTGRESLRFAPGWRDPKAEDFWSYAFVMWINEAAPDKARIKALLEKYYDGLLSSFAAGKNKDISKTPTRVEVVETAPNHFEVKMHVIDAFATFEPIDLRVVVNASAETDKRAVLHIQVSPQPKEHLIWRSLEAAIASIVSQEGARYGKQGDTNADPMANFARMIGGEWKMTTLNGMSTFDTWHWGPGQHSVRVMTEGFGADGKPWRELQVYYWHPNRKQVCLLGLSPFAEGVSEGSIKFEGTSADAVFNLDQSGGRRRQMGLRWNFDGPDKYREILLEATDTADLAPLTQWDHLRSMTPRTKPVRGDEEAPKLSERLKVFEPLLGRNWDTRGKAKGKWDGGEPFHIETKFEWVPLANAIYARTFALRGNGTPMHVLDTYFFHHTGTDRLRCLALSNWGDWQEAVRGVYEGDVTLEEGGALQIDLKGFEGERDVSYRVQFDFKKDGVLDQRAWSVDGAQHSFVLAVRHTASEMSQNILVVFQDKKNNYWFGSGLDGVYRYDGNTIKHFTMKDGLSGDGVGGIQEDTAGNLYFATSNGISKFDGNTFITLTAVKSDPPDKEWKLEPGDLWFPGGQDGDVVSRYDGKVLHSLSFPEAKLGEKPYAQFPLSNYPRERFRPYVYSIYKDTKGHVWFGTGTGSGSLSACRFDGKSFTWISSDELEFGDIAYCVRSIVEDKDGKFWFSNTKHRYDVFQDDAAGPENAVKFKKEEGVSHSEDDFPFFMSSTKDHKGDLWMASFGAGVWRYDGEHVSHYPVQDDGKPVTLFSIYRDNQGDFWLGSHEAGAYKFNGKSFEKFLFPQRPSQAAPSNPAATSKDELKGNPPDNAPRAASAQEPTGEAARRDPYFTPTESESTSYMPKVIIRNIREDRAGNIWFATFGGPIRYDGKEFTNFSEEVGLARTRIFSLLEDRSGALWFGSITGGASRYDGKSFTKFTEKEGVANNDVSWIFEDRDGNIWFATDKGVSRYDGKSMTNYTTKDGLIHDSVYTIGQDSAGRIWFGTQGGICSYDGKSFSNLAEQVGRSFVNIRTMAVDRSGNLWFGGQEGAFRYDGKSVTTFTSKDGLLDDFVGSMIVDRAGNIWLGHPGGFPAGQGGGASRYDGKTFVHFPQKDGLGSKTVYAMFEDKAGNIWFGSVDAVASRYDGKTFTNFSTTAPPSLPPQGK